MNKLLIVWRGCRFSDQGLEGIFECPAHIDRDQVLKVFKGGRRKTSRNTDSFVRLLTAFGWKNLLDGPDTIEIFDDPEDGLEVRPTAEEAGAYSCEGGETDG